MNKNITFIKECELPNGEFETDFGKQMKIVNEEWAKTSNLMELQAQQTLYFNKNQSLYEINNASRI